MHSETDAMSSGPTGWILAAAILGLLHQAGTASGVNNAVSRVASLLSIAVLGIIAFHAFDIQLERKLDAANLPASVKHGVLEQRNRLTQIEPPSGLNADQQGALKRSINESFLGAFRWVMVVCAALAVLSAVSAWGMIDGKARRTVKTGEVFE